MLRRRGGDGPRRGRDDGGTQYQMRQKLASIGDDFYIQDNHGRRAFHVDGKALRVRDTLLFKDMQGNELYKIQEKMARVRDSMNVYRGDDVAASVHKAMITPLRERWSVNVPGGQDMSIQGNILDHEYTFERGGNKVAEVSKRWFRVADTYGVEIDEGEDDALILACTVVVDAMAHEGR
jgi:uncharacterized protein YxjI